MDNIKIANETIKISKEREYVFGEKTIRLPEVDIEDVIVISPGDGQYMAEKMARTSRPSGRVLIKMAEQQSEG